MLLLVHLFIESIQLFTHMGVMEYPFVIISHYCCDCTYDLSMYFVFQYLLQNILWLEIDSIEQN